MATFTHYPGIAERTKTAGADETKEASDGKNAGNAEVLWPVN